MRQSIPGFIRWTSVFLVTGHCLMQRGRANVIPGSNPCMAYSSCVLPVTIPTARVMTMLFAFNLFRFADGRYLTNICQNLQGKSYCMNHLSRCRTEGWPQAADFQNSDFQLALWVCSNRDRFESNRDCWKTPFLSRMSSCTGLVTFLEPVDCLMDKIQDLPNCSQSAIDLFQDLLSVAHTS